MSEEEVLAYVADARFHRVFHLPANPSKQREKPLRVSYSDVGRAQCANDEEEARKPTIFFCGGFFAGRYLPLSLGADAVLKARGVRFITIDKPGMGGTEPVPLNRRVDIYLGM
jgi:pimeloyl-ACP methyl ester carboxylesterase